MAGRPADWWKEHELPDASEAVAAARRIMAARQEDDPPLDPYIEALAMIGTGWAQRMVADNPHPEYTPDTLPFAETVVDGRLVLIGGAGHPLAGQSLPMPRLTAAQIGDIPHSEAEARRRAAECMARLQGRQGATGGSVMAEEVGPGGAAANDADGDDDVWEEYDYPDEEDEGEEEEQELKGEEEQENGHREEGVEGKQRGEGEAAAGGGDGSGSAMARAAGNARGSAVVGGPGGGSEGSAGEGGDE